MEPEHQVMADRKQEALRGIMDEKGLGVVEDVSQLRGRRVGRVNRH